MTFPGFFLSRSLLSPRQHEGYSSRRLVRCQLPDSRALLNQNSVYFIAFFEMLNLYPISGLVFNISSLFHPLKQYLEGLILVALRFEE